MQITLTAGRAVLLPIAAYAWQVLGARQTFTPVNSLLFALGCDGAEPIQVPRTGRAGDFDVAARHEERKFAGSALAEEYARYRKRTFRSSAQ